jgi:hypothetical protein
LPYATKTNGQNEKYNKRKSANIHSLLALFLPPSTIPSPFTLRTVPFFKFQNFPDSLNQEEFLHILRTKGEEA